jgi:3-deoxy-7-phosphoheptulonate synthase
MKEKLLTTRASLKKELPLSEENESRIAAWRKELIAILQGKSEKILLIVGPCSIHNIDSALIYAERLRELQEAVQDTFFIVMRAYLEKARTGLGWRGFLWDPQLDGSCDTSRGLFLSRQFLLKLTTLGLPAGMEFVDPLAAPFISDLVTWGCIGARTVQSPIHRYMASALPMPVGFKNRTDGNIEIAIQAARVAAEPQTFFAVNDEGMLVERVSRGNVFPHIVLRGGDRGENYREASLFETRNLLELVGMPPHVIVDVSHGNCSKNFKRQPQIFASLIDGILRGARAVRGIMMESFLEEGAHISCNHKNSYPSTISITDPCLDFATTRDCIKNGHSSLLAQAHI